VKSSNTNNRLIGVLINESGEEVGLKEGAKARTSRSPSPLNRMQLRQSRNHYLPFEIF